jgi:hypothetical protein
MVAGIVICSGGAAATDHTCGDLFTAATTAFQRHLTPSPHQYFPDVRLSLSLWLAGCCLSVIHQEGNPPTGPPTGPSCGLQFY